MLDMISEAMENIGFWLLFGGGTAATLIGWKMSKSMGASLPFWQIILIVVVIFLASMFFATRD